MASLHDTENHTVTYTLQYHELHLPTNHPYTSRERDQKAQSHDNKFKHIHTSVLILQINMTLLIYNQKVQSAFTPHNNLYPKYTPSPF